MTAPKVAIGIPYRKTWEGRTGMAMMGLVARSAAQVAMLPIGSDGCYVEENRNGIVQYAFDTGIPFDWLLWIDTDMIFPDDSLLRLLAHSKNVDSGRTPGRADIVGANYRQRIPPYSFVGFYMDGSDAHLNEPGLHRMRHLPAGLLLTRFDIYRKLKPPWYRAPRVKGEPRDEVYFCNAAREAGYEIWCDHDLTREVRHIGDQEIPWFLPEQIVKVEGAYLKAERHETETKERAQASRMGVSETEYKSRSRVAPMFADEAKRALERERSGHAE